MTNIFKYQFDLDEKALKKLQKFNSLGIDVETTGLKIPIFDKLSLIQISSGQDDAYIVQPDRKNYQCKNLAKLLNNKEILFVFHYARFDVSALEYFLKVDIKKFYCTKVCSKIIRGYSQSHGLKDLVFEFIGKKLDKRYGQTDWNKNLLSEITDKQLEYAANDCKFLISIKDKLNVMLEREGKKTLYEECLKFIKTRIKLDQIGITGDIFSHE